MTYRDSDCAVQDGYFGFNTASPPMVSGVGGGTGICSLIGPGPQRMDPVHVPVADHRRCAPTTTCRLFDDVKP